MVSRCLPVLFTLVVTLSSIVLPSGFAAPAADWSHAGAFYEVAHMPGLAVIEFGTFPHEKQSKRWQDIPAEDIEFCFTCVVYDTQTAGRSDLRISDPFEGQFSGADVRCGDDVIINFHPHPCETELRRLRLPDFSLEPLPAPSVPGRLLGASFLGPNHVVVNSFMSNEFPDAFALFEWSDCRPGDRLDLLAPGSFWVPIPSVYGARLDDGIYRYQYSGEKEEFVIAHLETSSDGLFWRSVRGTLIRPLAVHPKEGWFAGADWQNLPKGLYVLMADQGEEKKLLDLEKRDRYEPRLVYIPETGDLIVGTVEEGKAHLYRIHTGEWQTSEIAQADDAYTLVGWNEPTNELLVYCEPRLVRFGLETGEWTEMATVRPPSGPIAREKKEGNRRNENPE